MSTRMRRAYLGEDVPIQITYTDPDTGDPSDPDDTSADGTPDAEITIEDDDENAIVDNAAMNNLAVGEFEYVWDTDVDAAGVGTYTVTVSADFDGETKLERIRIPLE